MNSTATLVELVNLWHTYEKESSEASIADFCRLYLASQKEASSVWKESEKWEGVPILSQVGQIFGRLTRFGLMYSKKALNPVNLYNAIDFNYLRTLNEQESIKKSELIFLSITDFTTGIEVIKRLIRNKYAEEFPDVLDKRSKRIKITSKGKEILVAGMTQIKKLAPISFGVLSEDEIHILLGIFKKLDHHHTSIFKEVRNLEFEEIMEKYGKPLA